MTTGRAYSRCLLAMSEAYVTQSVRYCECGVLCCWHWRTVTPSLHCTRSGTSSQCKSTCSRRDRPRSNLRVPLTRRAAAFSTRWSLSQTSAPRLVQSYSNRGTSWQRRARVSPRTRRRVNVGLVSVLAKPEKNVSHTRCSSDGLLLNFSWFYVQDIPHQMNGSDCGMFACKFAEYVARNARITFSQVSWHRCVVYCSSAAMLDFVFSRLLTLTSF